MKREFPVRFCERLGLKCPCLLDFCFAPITQANPSAKQKEPIFATTPTMRLKIFDYFLSCKMRYLKLNFNFAT